MIVCLLMVMVRDDCLPLPLTNKQSSLTITINKQTIISHHYHQQTNNHLSPLPSTNKQSSLTINVNKQTVISQHYHQQTNNQLSDDCLFVHGNGER
jgi:demethoxyubiquinone hydroxylase (CLK1/Coq7/Cat5 family)